jgi:3-oxoacyl-[acyl-carrier protein] reductase
VSGLAGRAALVTGGARGIGAAIGSALAGNGAAVVLGDLDAAAAARSAREIDPSGERVGAVALDVRSRASFDAALAETVARHGSLDVLVNNAAVTVRRPFFEIDEAEWDEVLRVNLRGVYFGCALAGARMAEQGFGRIVNVSSLAGQQGGLLNGAHYAASKAGILALTKVAARELAPRGVTVNAVAPAAIEGPVMAGLPPGEVDALRGSIPLGRLGLPAEVGALVAFLASDAAGYLTGATLDLNGGLLMR